jgi:hypothetical protein
MEGEGPGLCKASTQCTGAWREAVPGSPGAQGHITLFFVLFLGLGLWSIKGSWRSAPCSASLQSNCLFPRRLSEKDDIYQSLLSGDLGGREKGRVYSVEAGTENEENLQGRKPQSCWDNHREITLGMRTATPCSTTLLPSPLHILTSTFSLAVPGFSASTAD